MPGSSGLQTEDAGEWRRDPQANAGGQLWGDGWHKYATAMWWTGDEVERLSSLVTKTDDFVIESNLFHPPLVILFASSTVIGAKY